jgi:hypothetical protein
MARVNRKRNRRWRSLLLPAAMLLATTASLMAVLRVYALPTEARSTQAWYTYQSTVGFDYTAKVQPSSYYQEAEIPPNQLIRRRLPVEPAAYRRVLLSRYADSIQVKVPYQFQGDRPATLLAKVRVDGQLVLPGVYQKPMPWSAEKSFTVSGEVITGTETFTIPLRPIFQTLEDTRKTLEIAIEPIELKIQPTFEVQVLGLAEPLTVITKGEHQVDVRSATVEVDDPKETRQAKTLSQTVVTPTTLDPFGLPFSVSTLRMISVGALLLFLLIALLLTITRRRHADERGLLERLKANLVVARGFEVPPGVAIAEIPSARELLQVHAQTDRPVIQVNQMYYLLDGATCYRLDLDRQSKSSDGA